MPVPTSTHAPLASRHDWTPPRSEAVEHFIPSLPMMTKLTVSSL
jgi:hypothetical protein